jgi:hypothetical protein
VTDYSGITFKIDAAFDTGFAKAGVKKYFMNIDYDKDDSDPGNVLEHVQLTLKEDGVSTIKSTRKETYTDDTSQNYYNSSTAKVSSGIGSLLDIRINQSSNTAIEGFFDSAFATLAKGDNSAFASGGKLHVAQSDLLGELPSNVQVSGFTSDDWDCSKTTEITPTVSDTSKVCSKPDYTYHDCYDGDFAGSPVIAEGDVDTSSFATGFNTTINGDILP